PRDRFLVAGEAWEQCRSGRARAQDFGIFDMRGLWFIAGNLLRDLAALNRREMLPWDIWGAMQRDDASLGEPLRARLDRLAALTLEPDRNFDALRRAYDGEADLQVPPQVFNAERQQLETVG